MSKATHSDLLIIEKNYLSFVFPRKTRNQETISRDWLYCLLAALCKHTLVFCWNFLCAYCSVNGILPPGWFWFCHVLLCELKFLKTSRDHTIIIMYTATVLYSFEKKHLVKQIWFLSFIPQQETLLYSKYNLTYDRPEWKRAAESGNKSYKA